MNAMVATATRTRPLTDSVRALASFDLRRFRMFAALMVAFELGRAAFVEWSLRLQPVGIGERFSGTFGTEESAVLDVLLGIATAVGTALIVQADLPSDDRAFWRTRPIAPIVLALGKLTTLALLFVALPSAINAVRLLAYGAPLSAVAASTVQIAVQAGAVVVPAWALALATRTLPRFLGTVVGLLVLGVLTVGALNYWLSMWDGGMPARFRNVRVGVGADWQGRYRHGWWSALAMTVGGVTVLAGHYWHRRRVASIAATLVLLAIPALIPSGAPPTDAPSDLARLVSGRLGIGALQLPGQPLLDARRRSGTPFPIPLEVVFTLPELPPDVSARLITRHNRLIGRGTVPVSDGWQCCFGPGPRAAVSSTPSGAVPARPAQGFAIDAADLATLRGGTASFRGDAEVRFERHRLAADIPLRPGSAVEVAGQRIEVLAANPQRSALLVRYLAIPSLADSGSALSVFVGDADRRQVATSVPGWGGPSGPLPALAWQRQRFGGRNWAGRFHVLLDLGPAIRPDARLYVVETRAAGTLRMPIAIDGIPLRSSGSEPVPRPR